MKLPDVIILSLAAGFLIIGIHQIIVVSFAEAYWILMLALILFFVYNYRKRK